MDEQWVHATGALAVARDAKGAVARLRLTDAGGKELAACDAATPLTFFTARELARFCYRLAEAASEPGGDRSFIDTGRIADAMRAAPMAPVVVQSAAPDGKGGSREVECRSPDALFTALAWWGEHPQTRARLYAPFELGPVVDLPAGRRILLPGAVADAPARAP
jgi:hypothetical protein